MEFAFNTERSVQDAIAELSESETSTVMISYTVMFIYVAVALGSFKSCYTLLVCIHLHVYTTIVRRTGERKKYIVFYSFLGPFKVHISIWWHCNCYWISDMQFGCIGLYSFGNHNANN